MASKQLFTYTSDLSGDRCCELTARVSQRAGSEVVLWDLDVHSPQRFYQQGEENLELLHLTLCSYARVLMLGQPLNPSEDDHYFRITPHPIAGHILHKGQGGRRINPFVMHLNDIDLANLISVLEQFLEDPRQRLARARIAELPFPPRALARELAQGEGEAVAASRAATVVAKARMDLRRADAEATEKELMDKAGRLRSEVNDLTTAIDQLDLDEMSVLQGTQPRISNPFHFGRRHSPTLIIPVTHGWLMETEGTWQANTETIDVEGYRESLSEEIDLTMLKVPSGNYMMGSATPSRDFICLETPRQSVTLDEFHLSQSPVTQAQWELVSGWPKEYVDLPRNPSRFKGMHRPVEQVSWREAMEFCLRLRRHTSREYTLPSEEQWEYACRAGTTTPFSFGMILTTAIANYDGNYFEQNAPKGLDRQETTTVNSFPANRWGLHDMHGNVWEWCVNRGANDDTRMIRGGSWGDGPVYCRSTIRQAITQTTKSDRLGFRLCVPAPGYSAERRQGLLHNLLLQYYGTTSQLKLIMAEIEEWRSEIQRLAQYTPDLFITDQPATESQPGVGVKSADSNSRYPTLVSIRTTCARYINDRIIRDLITVTGFQEELDLGFNITMLQIPAGEFMMGSEERDVILSRYEKPDDQHDKPRHRVQLQSFFLGQYPVTQLQWKIVAEWPMVKRELNPKPSDCYAPNRPVASVSWHEAIEFCQRLSRKTQRFYTLPSEAQWEYACRAGTTTAFAYGETLTPELANYDLGNTVLPYFMLKELAKVAPNKIDLTSLADHHWPETTQVGIFPSNPWGLYDMHGNVFEWCLDDWNPDYRYAPNDGSAWTSSGDSTARVRRGGSWDWGVESTSSAHRSWRSLGVVDRNTGFRLCLAPGSLIS